MVYSDDSAKQDKTQNTSYNLMEQYRVSQQYSRTSTLFYLQALIYKLEN